MLTTTNFFYNRMWQQNSVGYHSKSVSAILASASPSWQYLKVLGCGTKCPFGSASPGCVSKRGATLITAVIYNLLRGTYTRTHTRKQALTFAVRESRENYKRIFHYRCKRSDDVIKCANLRLRLHTFNFKIFRLIYRPNSFTFQLIRLSAITLHIPSSKYWILRVVPRRNQPIGKQKSFGRARGCGRNTRQWWAQPVEGLWSQCKWIDIHNRSTALTQGSPKNTRYTTDSSDQ